MQIPKVPLETHGLSNLGEVYWNLHTPALYEEIVRRREGLIAHLGPLVLRTGHQTGRSPQDKFIVKEPSSEDKIWWGKENRPFTQDRFDAIYGHLLGYLQGRDLFVQDCYVGADPKFKKPIRIISEYAWHNLFSRNLFIQIKAPERVADHVPQFTLIDAPRFHANPAVDGTNSEVFILVHFGKKLIIIGGTSYAGEIKKAIFTIQNYLLPQENVLSMHCSATMGNEGDVALLFGLSGTGKTSLSADPERMLIGDDEHGWSDDGIFNFEGGCYAKAIRLSREAEPYIYECTRKFSTLLENVTIDHHRRSIDLDDTSLTENTRAAYPLSHIPNAHLGGTVGHPSHIIMLTCDAFGVMPPIAKLTPLQARYHFLSGYTAKIAGTETEIGDEPQATFSACFGAPFMTLNPTVYSKLLGEKIAEHNVNCWLVNTGWIKGPYGVGSRIKIGNSRALIKAALTGQLDDVSFRKDPIFGFQVPESCPGVPEEILNPRNTWKNPKEYDAKARELAGRFKENFVQFESAPKEVRDAGPSI